MAVSSLLFEVNAYKQFYLSFCQRAIEEGADFIETDVLSSKDGVLICFHDYTLDETTNVASHKEFADRNRTYEVQGSNKTGFFTCTFPSHASSFVSLYQ